MEAANQAGHFHQKHLSASICVPPRRRAGRAFPGSLQMFGSVGWPPSVLFWVLSQPAFKLCKTCRRDFLTASSRRAGSRHRPMEGGELQVASPTPVLRHEDNELRRPLVAWGPCQRAPLPVAAGQPAPVSLRQEPPGKRHVGTRDAHDQATAEWVSLSIENPFLIHFLFGKSLLAHSCHTQCGTNKSTIRCDNACDALSRSMNMQQLAAKRRPC